MWTCEQMGVRVCASLSMRMVGESQAEEDEAGEELGVTSREDTFGEFNNGSFCNFYMVVTLKSLSLQCPL